MRVTSTLLILVLLAQCTSTPRQETTPETPLAIDSIENLNPPPTDIHYDYSSFYGVFIIESSNGGFKAMLVIEPQGLELRYTLTTKNGDCTGTATGSIAMVSHAAYYHTGYSMEEKCKLEFILRHTERKIDVKEIHDCTLHGPLCAFEGTYTKVEAEVN